MKRFFSRLLNSVTSLFRQNPLLAPSTLPNHAPPFDRIREGDYLPAFITAIDEARANIAAIRNNPAKPDFKNTITALETASEKLGVVSGVFHNLLGAAGTDELQRLAEEDIGPREAAFSDEVSMDPGIFKRVKAVYENRHNMALTPEEATVLENTYKGFVRSGALLDDAGKKRLREINERLAVLGPLFSKNIKKYVEGYELRIADKADLAGLPANAVAAAAEAAEAKGYKGEWLITLDYPSYMPVMQYADNRALREKLWIAFNSKACAAPFDNNPAVLEMVRLHDESAKLLGYKNYAAYVLEERMAKTPENVWAFLDKLKAAYKPAAQADLKMLRDFAAQAGGPSDLKPWDIAYYAEKLKQSQFDFSDEDLRPYFPLEKVLEGTFTHFSKLFNVEFKPNAAYPVWHQDVKAFDVLDKAAGAFVGTLYADFFPRPGSKSDGAWMNSFRNQGLFGGNVERPVIGIVCNFTKPTKGTPSLLTHEEVLTLFHEMGHAMHGLLSDVKHPSVAGTSVRWDFVELPSQVQENWAYTKETLDLISGHYQTGEKIPESLMDKLQKSKNFMAGWYGMRQVNLATLDMHWYTAANPGNIKDVAAFEDQATADTALFPRFAGPGSPSFSHIFSGGYSAGYYSYKWAEVLDADVFALFKERGLYHQPTAHAYKTEILAKGGSEPPDVIFSRFRGRDPDPDALLRREGLLNAPKP